MNHRPITEREFVSYAKGLGNYCTYSDTLKIIEAIFQIFKQVLGRDAGNMLSLLPASLKPLWENVASFNLSGESIINLIQYSGSLSTTNDAEKALIVFFGTIKEKQTEYIDEWEALIPDEVRIYWERSETIEEMQDACQLL